MISGSLSILSFPFNADAFPHSTTTALGIFNSHPSSTWLRTPNNLKQRPSPTISRRRRTLTSKIEGLFNSSNSSAIEDGDTEQFLENNSIADFMRFTKNEENNGALQTAVVSYRKKFPWFLLQPFLQVDLVSTIHIGDKEYFATLQKELESYDCVLYEMVASRESLENRKYSSPTRKLRSSRSRGFNILGCIQRQMAQVLSLNFQLDCLDYQSDKWYHADLDYETFKLLQRERGESFFSFARDMTLQSAKAMVQPASIPGDLGPWKSKLLWASRVLPMPLVGLFIIGSVCTEPENQSTEYPELEALSRLDLGAAMKFFLARQLTSEFTQVTTAVEEKSVIIGERNKVAAEALQRAIESGCQRIAVLYGGGHMPDLGRRLREDFTLAPSGVQWITAWSIKSWEPKRDHKFLPFLKDLADLSGWPLNRYQTLALLIFSSVLAIDLWFWELFFGSVVNLAGLATTEITRLAENLQLF